MTFIEITLAILSGSILYTFQTALKYLINKDRIFNLKVWVTSNWKVWMYSFIGSVLAAAAYTFSPEWSNLIGSSFKVDLDGTTASFLLAGTALGALIKTQIEDWNSGKNNIIK